MTEPRFLILPGYGNSGPEHWQSLWQAELPGAVRIEQASWDEPEERAWVRALEETMKRLGPDTVLVAHSLACLMVAKWVYSHQGRAKAALLVAPPDPASPRFPAAIRGFSNLEEVRFPFKTLVAGSTDDPYSEFDYTVRCAKTWGAEWVSLGNSGHINTSSGYGPWPEGLRLLRTLF